MGASVVGLCVKQAIIHVKSSTSYPEIRSA